MVQLTIFVILQLENANVMKTLLVRSVMRLLMDGGISQIPHVRISMIFDIFDCCWLFTEVYNLLACGCDADGSTSETCDKSSGKCDCKDSVVGDKCTQCSTEHWGFPNCQGKGHFYKYLMSRRI